MRKYQNPSLSIIRQFQGWGSAEEFLSRDKYIAPLIEKYGHCEIKPSPKSNYFLDLADAIVSQQLSGKAAGAIFNRVRVELGRVSPSSILEKSDESLRACGLSWAKVKYLKDLADKTRRGVIKVKMLGGLSDEEIVSELVQVKGIGRWTSEMFLMFTLARPDIFPLDDLGINKGFEKVVKKMNKDRMSKFSLRWSPYRTVVSWYLWKMLDSG